MNASWVWCVAVLAVGCGGSSVSSDSTGALEVVLPSRSAAPSPKSRQQILAESACAQLSPCSLVGERGSYLDQGQEHVVVLLARGTENFSGAPVHPIEPAHSYVDGTDLFDRNFSGCARFEAWLLALEPSEAKRERLIASVCNDGHGAAGIGESSLTVRGREVTLSEQGGSNWRWSNSVTALLPDTLTVVSSEAHWVFGENSDQRLWNFQTRIGTRSWAAPRCGGSSEELASFDSAVIPVLELPPAFHKTAWSSVELEACATRIDGLKSGFALGGAAPTPSAALVVVGDGDSLFVEIEDDEWELGSGPHDRLELWTAPKAQSYFDQCLPPASAPEGFEIQLTQAPLRRLGKASGGATPALRWSKDPAHPRRIAIDFSKLPPAFTLVYRDVDRAGPARDIATSRFDPLEAASLGAPSRPSPEVLSCTVNQGKLERLPVSVPVDQPLLSAGLVQ